jgi:DNA-binding MarR family transcriptional regulator
MEKRNDDKLISTIFTLSRMMREKFVHGTKHHDSSSLLQVKTLGIVAELKNPSMKEIADCLHILSPSATDIINRLVKSGMLIRIKDAGDRRVVRLALTTKGRHMLSSGLREFARKIKNVMSVLNASEKKELTELLAKIIERSES